MGHLRLECPLMECDLGWEVHTSECLWIGKNLPMMVPICFGQKTVTTLLDNGSSVSLVRAYMVPPAQPFLRYTDVAGGY